MIGQVSLKSVVAALVIANFATMVTACGGSSGSSGGGGGNSLSISFLEPSSVMPHNPVGVTVHGQGFTPQSQVLADGQPVSDSIFADSGTLEANLDDSFFDTAATHQFTVQTGEEVSNSLPFTVYSPQPGPQSRWAIRHWGF